MAGMQYFSRLSNLDLVDLASELLHELGFTIAALALAPETVGLREFAAERPERVALLLGSEGDGLSRQALGVADVTVTIPMGHGVDSLNVAAASAVALYALGSAAAPRTPPAS